ncbi:MAG: nicotinate (nicotinamide) nucleotide adenylyltransferase [Saprospiraceae bacterium]|jgi:nicotinate-nucleotide adenylyltransferase
MAASDEHPAPRIGLFFGSYNPVHIGHMIIANFMATRAGLKEVWLVVSPHNPLKARSTLAPDYDRLHLVRLAIGDNPRLRASDIEFSLPRPSYTIDTLTLFKERFPDKQFVLIMGSDNLATLHRWKNYEILLRDYPIYVYARPGQDIPPLAASLPSVTNFEVPLMHVSSSYIRECIREGYSVQYLVPDAVYDYLDKTSLYRR